MRRPFLTLLGGLLGLVLALVLYPPTVPEDWAFRAVVHPEVPPPGGPSLGAPPSERPNPESPGAVIDRESLPEGGPSSAPADSTAELRERLRDRARLPTSGVRWLESRLSIRSMTEHYRVHTNVSREAAEEVALALESVRPRLVKRFGAADPDTLDDRFPVFVYSDRGVYARSPASREVAWPEGRWGFFDGRGNAHVQILEGAAEFLTLLTHEAAHQHHVAALGGGGPRWFKEGVAHAFEWRPSLATSLDSSESGLLAASSWPPEEGASPTVLCSLLATDPGGRADEAMLMRFVQSVDSGAFDLDRLLLAGSTARSGLDEASERAFGYHLIRYLRNAQGGAYSPWYLELERQLSSGGPVPARPEEAPKAGHWLDEVRKFSVSCRPTPQVRFVLATDDGDQAVVAAGAVPALSIGDLATESLPSEVRFSVVGLRGEEQVGLAMRNAASARLMTWWIDREGSTLTVEDRDGSRSVASTVRVMPPFTMEIVFGPSAGVRVRRSGMTLLDDPSFSAEGAHDLAIVFRPADDSAFTSELRVQGFEWAPRVSGNSPASER